MSQHDWNVQEREVLAGMIKHLASERLRCRAAGVPYDAGCLIRYVPLYEFHMDRLCDLEGAHLQRANCVSDEGPLLTLAVVPASAAGLGTNVDTEFDRQLAGFKYRDLSWNFCNRGFDSFAGLIGRRGERPIYLERLFFGHIGTLHVSRAEPYKPDDWNEIDFHEFANDLREFMGRAQNTYAKHGFRGPFFVRLELGRIENAPTSPLGARFQCQSSALLESVNDQAFVRAFVTDVERAVAFALAGAY